MSVPTTADDLFQLIGKSGLIDESKVASFRQAHQHDGLMQLEPKRIAAAMVRDGVLTYFHAEQFLLGKWRGFNIGKYRLLERIGVGGMGQVFLCEHVYMRKRVAIKVLPPTKAEDPVALGRFYREARVASALDHEHIVHTYDIDQEGALHFLVMEYVDGTSLLDIVKKFGPMNYVRACHYIKQTAIGLKYANECGMIHRDIKPGNIMVDRTGNAKILDMGLARFYKDEKDQLTLKYDDKNVLGTADYVSPEQTRDSRNIDVRSDLYGLGATLYYLLAGHPPFPNGTVAEKLIAHQMKKPQPVREVRPEIPQGLSKVVEKLLAKDPAERYQTPKDLVDALDIWTQSPLDPPPDEEMPRLSLAAQAGATYGKAPTTLARETVHSRSADTAIGRTQSAPVRPVVAALETAGTVPVLPKKPAFAPSIVPAANATDSASVVDLLVPPPPRPMSSVRSAAEIELSETRPLPADPTPQADVPSGDAAKPPELVKPKSKFDLRIPGFDLTRLQKPAAGAAGSRPAETDAARPPAINPKSQAPLPGSRESLRPPAGLPGSRDVSKPTTGLPGSRDVPKPTTGLPGSRDLFKPPLPLPSSREMPMPGSRETRLPLSGSKDQARSAPLPLSRDTLRPSLLPPSRDTSRPTGLEATPGGPGPAGQTGAAGQPVYRPPGLMPFFSAPRLPSRKPSAVTQFFRWLFLMALSSMIGAGLGTALWYFFLR